MTLSETEARELLRAHDHGVLATLHQDRGVDMTPVVYATDDDFLGSPVDEVKLKSSLRLQRERNLEADARATLLVEHWDRDDWSKLWWARAELRWVGPDAGERARVLSGHLADRFPQYSDEPFTAVLVFEITRVTGWSATGRRPET